MFSFQQQFACLSHLFQFLNTFYQQIYFINFSLNINCKRTEIGITSLKIFKFRDDLPKFIHCLLNV